ncbi:unnamed protein product [Lactuca virosa]|uniref:Uncharacterized protein n=1 Tax=Lactuca virosa TaxID=75947 RepID=A0AAU9N444_9ASTR|nr:unnamed protein product [Lactuca virosa]
MSPHSVKLRFSRWWILAARFRYCTNLLTWESSLETLDVFGCPLAVQICRNSRGINRHKGLPLFEQLTGLCSSLPTTLAVYIALNQKKGK